MSLVLIGPAKPTIAEESAISIVGQTPLYLGAHWLFDSERMLRLQKVDVEDGVK